MTASPASTAALAAEPRRSAWTAPQLAFLRELGGLGDAGVTTDTAELAGYRRDEAVTVPAGAPLAAVRPRTTETVQAVMRLAGRYGVPVVPRGAGSGLSGGANAVDGAVVLCLERMRSVLELDPDNLLAVVEPGVVNQELAEAAERLGLCYPPDPASRGFSTIGGNVATNAGGLCCVKYGVTRDAVLGLEAVLADGNLLQTGRRSLKGVAGYDLAALLVGSEGTLGVITQATVRLRPRPAAATTMLAFMPSLAAAGAATAEIRRTLVPSLLELLDQVTVATVEQWQPMGLDTDAAALLLAQSDAGGDQAAAEIAVLAEICRRHGARSVSVATDGWETEAYLAARRLAFPALQRRGATLLDDVAVPCARIPDLLTAVHHAARRYDVLIGTFGHAGDGNMHPTIVFDAADEQSVAAATGAFNDIVRSTLELGGTITGEHGVGALKRQQLADELGEPALRLHRSIKQLFDPAGLLNPGKLLP